MFRRLNKSAIWYLCQCVNHWLWNSSKLPFTDTVFQSASPSIQPTRTAARDGRPRVCGRLVSRSVDGIRFPTIFRCADSFTWATHILSSGQCHLCEHTSLTRLTTSTKYICGLSIGINVLPGFWHIIGASGLSTSAANGRDFTVKANRPQCILKLHIHTKENPDKRLHRTREQGTHCCHLPDPEWNVHAH